VEELARWKVFIFIFCVCTVNCEGRSYCGLFEKIAMGWILLKGSNHD